MAAIFLVCSRCTARMAGAELSGNVLDGYEHPPNATVTASSIRDHNRSQTISEKGGGF